MMAVISEVWLSGILVVACSGLTGILSAQSTPQTIQPFEVASIRPSSANDRRPALEFTPGGGLRATNVTLKMLIQMAYDIRPEQISGGVGWTDSEQFTVIAKSPAEAPAATEAGQKELTRQRLRTLLRERFQLELKQEAKPGSGYILTIEKQGHKLAVASDAGPVRQVGRWEFRAEGVAMANFARFLGVHLRATVEDRTGLEGHYTFHLKWNPELREGQSVLSLDGLPEDALVPAVREQLGLRLVQQRVTIDQYTIERAEKPGEN